jgi:adenylylsulfate kinase-like enzyme
MKKINKNKGILFWITGLSGSGKTTLGKKYIKILSKNLDPQ